MSEEPGSARAAGPVPRPSTSAPRAHAAGLGRRFAAYLEERFPLGGFGVLIVLFTFSSVAYSRLARHAEGFVPWPLFVVGALTTLVFFFLLRVLDEHKDQDLDRRWRPELPVPRGLVSLAELRWIGGIALVLVLALNLMVAPVLLLPFAGVAVWAALMTKEFFVSDWLRRHIGVYLITHMAIMPMIDAYSTGLDWLLADAHPPPGIVLFLVVTFLNGIVIEIGRKIHTRAFEREGVDTYSAAWGEHRAAVAWIVAVLGSAITAWLAARAAGGLPYSGLALAVAALAAAGPAVAFVARREERWARRIEQASRLWPLFTYLLLGTAPFVLRQLGLLR